jgi:hypothetical protein
MAAPPCDTNLTSSPNAARRLATLYRDRKNHQHPMTPDETSSAFTRRCAQLATLGIDHAVVISSGPWTVDRVARLAATARAVRDIPAAGRNS